MPSTWVWIRIALLPEDGLAKTTYGPDGQTRAKAYESVAQQLVRFPGAARVWADGADEDTVFTRTTSGRMYVWAITEYNGDALATVREWVEDFAGTMRSTGLDVQVAQPRQG